MICPVCNTHEIVQPDKGRKKKYCSDVCRYAAFAMHRRTITKVKCAYSKCRFSVIRGVRGKPKKYCSERCKRMAYRWDE